jgi:hypothetical protein
MWLLEGKEWPSVHPSSAADLGGGMVGGIAGMAVNGPLQIAPAPPKYLGESEDYGIRILEIKNETMEGGIQRSYVIEHKRHLVIGYQNSFLGAAILALAQMQGELDTAVGKNQVKS